MELITRHIIKERESGPVRYDFTTYPIIFETNEQWHPNFQAIMQHMRSAFVQGPQPREKSPSGAERIVFTLEQITESDERFRLVELARQAEYHGLTHWQHARVEKEILQFYPDCVCVEVPVHNDEWSGLIDTLLANPESGYVGIWDFKPDAHKERAAAGQNVLYKKMVQSILLSSGIEGVDITLVDCGYFDDENAYLII